MPSKRCTLDNLEDSLESKRRKILYHTDDHVNICTTISNSFLLLPPEIVTQILSMAYDCETDLIRLEKVCSLFYQIVFRFWNCILFKRFPTALYSIQKQPKQLTNINRLDWKNLYGQLKRLQNYPIGDNRQIGQAYHPKLDDSNQKVICPLCTLFGHSSPIIWHVSMSTTMCKECGLSIKDEDEDIQNECEGCQYMKPLTHECQNCQASFCSSSCKGTIECSCSRIVCSICSFDCVKCGTMLCNTCNVSGCQNCSL